MKISNNRQDIESGASNSNRADKSFQGDERKSLAEEFSRVLGRVVYALDSGPGNTKGLFDALKEGSNVAAKPVAPKKVAEQKEDVSKLNIESEQAGTEEIKEASKPKKKHRAEKQERVVAHEDSEEQVEEKSTRSKEVESVDLTEASNEEAEETLAAASGEIPEELVQEVSTELVADSEETTGKDLAASTETPTQIPTEQLESDASEIQDDLGEKNLPKQANSGQQPIVARQKSEVTDTEVSEIVQDAEIDLKGLKAQSPDIQTKEVDANQIFKKQVESRVAESSVKEVSDFNAFNNGPVILDTATAIQNSFALLNARGAFQSNQAVTETGASTIKSELSALKTVNSGEAHKQHAALTESHEDTKKSTTTTKSQNANNMEKVFKVLKEVAESKDGKTISFRLDPPELGNILVSVSTRHGQLNARLVAESAQINQMLREKAHELHSMLRKLGLNFSEVKVSVGNPDPGFNAFDFSQSGQFSNSGSQTFSGKEFRGSEGPGVNLAETGTVNRGKMEESTLDHWVA